MRVVVYTVSAVLFAATGFAQNVGVGVPTPQERLDVSGRLRLSSNSTAGAPTGGAGTIRWNATVNAFQGYVGAPVNDWVSFGSPAGLLSQTLSSGQVFVGNGSNIATGVALSGDATITNAGVLTIGTGAVTTGKILNGTILDEDINASAAIARTKLASGTANALVVNNASGVMTGLAPGANGNILTSDGTQWQSANPSTLFIRNQNTVTQPTSDFWISGTGRTGTSFQSPVYTRADAGTVSIRPNTDAVTAIQLQNAAGASILNVDATNQRVGIGTVSPEERLQVDGNVLFSRGGTKTLRVQSANAGNQGDTLRVVSGSAASSGGARSGGSLLLEAGNAYTHTDNTVQGGNVVLRSGGNRFTNPSFASQWGDIVFESARNVTSSSNSTPVERMRIDGPSGNVGINVTAPTQRLDIDGQDRIRGGAPGAGKVLTSDANGVGAWTDPTVGTVTNVTGTAPIAVANNTIAPVISLNDLGVTTAKLADNAVTNAKLSNMAANTVKLNATAGAAAPTDFSVGTNTVLGRQGGNIVAAQVATGQIADDAITSVKISDGTIVNADIANGTINLTQKVTGVLPIANGGTNSGAGLNNNRLMVSTGGAIVENAALGANLPIYTNASGLPTTTAPTTGVQGYWTRTGTNLHNTTLGDNVGVGVAAPQVKLHVTGGRVGVFDGNREWTMGAGRANGAGNGYPDAAAVTGGSFAIRDIWEQRDRLRIASDGNVGIGVLTPASRLQVLGKTTLSRSGDVECCGNDATIALADNPATTGRASISFHNAGESEGTIQLVQNLINGVTSRRIQFLDNQNQGLGLEISGSGGVNGRLWYGSAGSRTETRDDAGLQGDAGAQSGFYETAAPSANWYPGASSWQHLIDVRHSNTGNNFAMQFAGSFFDQRLFFRKTNNNAAQAWREIDAQIGFMARKNAAVAQGHASWLVHVFGAVDFNDGSGYDASNGRFTVPVGQAGVYQFNAHVLSHTDTDRNPRAILSFWVNGVERARVVDDRFDSMRWRMRGLNGSVTLKLNQGDYVEVLTYWETNNSSGVTWNGADVEGHFSGHKVYGTN